VQTGLKLAHAGKVPHLNHVSFCNLRIMSGLDRRVPSVPAQEKRKNHEAATDTAPLKKCKSGRRFKVELLELLGEGTFGQVWKARHADDDNGIYRQMGKFCAVKFYKFDKKHNGTKWVCQFWGGNGYQWEYKEDLIHKSARIDFHADTSSCALNSYNTEMSIMKTLRALPHPNVCVPFAIVSSGTVALMPCHGPSVRRVLETLPSKVLTDDKIRTIARGVLDGIQFLHNCKVVHADICPANILLSNNYTHASIIDFTIAFTSDRLGRTKWDRIMKEHFRPPECAFGGEVSTSVDIWGFGIVLYMLCKKKTDSVITWVDPSNYYSLGVVDDDPSWFYIKKEFVKLFGKDPKYNPCEKDQQWYGALPEKPPKYIWERCFAEPILKYSLCYKYLRKTACELLKDDFFNPFLATGRGGASEGDSGGSVPQRPVTKN
jgi:serine/threonine protein kinase